MSEKCEMCGDQVSDGGSGRLHDTYDCAVTLRSKLATAEARIAELEADNARLRSDHAAAIREMAKARRAAQDAQCDRDTAAWLGMEKSDEFVAGSLVKKLYDRSRALEAENARLTAELADVRELDAWLRGDKNHQIIADLGVVHGESISLLYNDERETAAHKVEPTFAAARRAAVEWIRAHDQPAKEE